MQGIPLFQLTNIKLSDMEHRAPWECTYAKEGKSKCKLGIPPKSDQEYFKILSLCVLQARLWLKTGGVTADVEMAFF